MIRKIDAAGREAIKHFESCRLEAYKDAVGVWTIGWGSTHGVHAGMTITQAEAEARFDEDLAPAESAVQKLVTVTLGDNQFAALVSFVFNLGEGALRRSTLLKELNAARYAAVPAELRRFVYAGGVKLQGLATRREAEAKLWLTPDTPAPAQAATPHPDKPAAPVAAAPASPSATEQTHGDTMTSNLVTEAEKGAVNFGAGITNFFENIGSQLTTVSKTLQAGKTTTTSGAPLPSVTTSGANVLSQIEGAGAAIGKLVTDAKAGNVGSAVEDGVALATTGMAVLTKFGISIPGLSTFTSMLTAVEAFV